jgi:hypothetical protein
MEILIGSMIKIFCVGGVMEAGKLIEHTKEQMVLELIDKSYTIIQNPDHNVIAIKISAYESKSRTEEDVFIDVELNSERYERREDLRVASLAELQKLKANEERKRAKEKLTSYQLTQQPEEVAFGIPDFSKSVSKYPKKKVR